MSSQYFPSYKNKGEISVKLDLVIMQQNLI